MVPSGNNPMFGLKALTDGSWDGKLSLTDRGITVEVLCRRVTHSSSGQGVIVFEPTESGVVVTPPSDAILSVIFHLLNFPDFSGPDDYVLTHGEPPTQGMTRCGRTNLVADGWKITIAGTDRTCNLAKDLKDQGGYVITHFGRIERENGSIFSSEDIKNLLTCLHYFLSFVLGRWAGTALPIGMNANGERVFEEWGLRMTADGSWSGSTSWFDIRHSELLPQVFPGFVALWKNELWQRALSEGLYWYLGSCDRRTGVGVDTGLILAQTALELFAWTYCVQDRKMVSAAAFKPRGLSAADKLRILASSLSIPLELPPNLPALNAKRGQPWKDSMDAITGIRNALVHPDAQRHDYDDSYYEAWKLSLWYIDLILLRLCNHNGKYANRLASRWVGHVQRVPWA